MLRHLLFLAGKAEETAKKCQDLIKTVSTLTNDHQFSQVESRSAFLLSLIILIIV